MGIFSRLRDRAKMAFSRWREVGEYRSTFASFGSDAYRSELVRSCIRPLSDFTGKANAKSSDKRIEALLNGRPNMYMSGKEFLMKCRTMYELKNNCFIYIDRDDKGKPISFFPVPYVSLEALEYAGRLFIQFRYADGSTTTLPWDDLAVLRKDYNESSIVGDDNRAILQTLELINTTNQGLANAIRATANLRGILKSTKAMLAPEAVKEQKEQFVRDYLTLENSGGIASLDATQEFTPIKMDPVVTSWEQSKELRENVYRYFGVSDAIIMGTCTSEQLECFYELRIEPFLVDLSTELTTKCFGNKAVTGFGNYVVFEANKLQFASLEKKISVFKEVVLNSGMTVNEWRLGCNMAPVPWGDDPIRRLDVGDVNSEENPKDNSFVN